MFDVLSSRSFVKELLRRSPPSCFVIMFLAKAFVDLKLYKSSSASYSWVPSLKTGLPAISPLVSLLPAAKSRFVIVYICAFAHFDVCSSKNIWLYCLGMVVDILPYMDPNRVRSNLNSLRLQTSTVKV